MSAWTLGFQIVNFLVLAVLLHRFLFKPIRDMIARRQQELERVASEAERARHEAEGLRDAARRDLAGVGEEQGRLLAEARAQSAREREESLAEARREATRIVEAANREVEIERKKAVEALAGQAVDMAAAVVRRLLEPVATAKVAESFVERLSAHLDTLSAERRRELRDELDGEELVLAVAPAPSADAATRWIATITRRLGEGIGARVVADDSLVAGAELRFPHTTLSFCWRDGLETAREELLHHADHR